MGVIAIQAFDAAWNPLVQQSVEPDTIFLQDPAGDAARSPAWIAGHGGAIPTIRADPPSTAAGPFTRLAYAPAATDGGFFGAQGAATFPGVTSRTGTLEGHVAFTADWSTLTGAVPFALGTYSNHWLPVIDSGTISIYVAHNQNPASLPTYTVRAHVSITSGQFIANTFYSLATTLSPAGVLSLILGGAIVAQVTDVVLPATWADDLTGSAGLVIAGYAGGPCYGCTVAEVRLSRLVRTPGVVGLTAKQRSAFNIAKSTLTGATVQANLGGVLAGVIDGTVTPAMPIAGATSTVASQGAVPFARTDKLISCSPFSASSGTYAYAGHYTGGSWDTQVWERSLLYIKNLGVTTLFLNMDSIHEADGGANGPYTASSPFTNALTTGYAYNGPINPPSTASTTSFLLKVQDFLYWLLTDSGLGYTAADVIVAGANEPDSGAASFDGTQAQYMAWCIALASAAKAVNASLRFAGPGIGSWSSSESWIIGSTGIIAAFASASTVLDIVDWHYFSGDLSEFAQVSLAVAAQATASSVTAPKLLASECSWCAGIQAGWPYAQPPYAGADPGPDRDTNWQLNDWSAAFLASVFIEAQNVEAVGYVNCNWLETFSTFFDSTGTYPQAQYNVMRLWALLAGLPVVQTTVVDADTNVRCLAAWDSTTSKLYVFLASLHYRAQQSSQPVMLTLPGIDSGTTVVKYVVNAGSSDDYDAGSGAADLASPATLVPVNSAGQVGTVMLPREVCVLVIG